MSFVVKKHVYVLQYSLEGKRQQFLILRESAYKIYSRCLSANMFLPRTEYDKQRHTSVQSDQGLCCLLLRSVVGSRCYILDISRAFLEMARIK